MLNLPSDIKKSYTLSELPVLFISSGDKNDASVNKITDKNALKASIATSLS